MKAFILTIIATLTLSISYSQSKQTNWWYFGDKAGLNFNKIVSGLPTPLSNGAMVSQEGCASISDKNGNLLFYTDGVTVWNKNHRVMTNGTGLLGNFSSTQSALILPFPGNSKKYYVFTIWTRSNTGLRYSVVDMSQSSGLGAVISSSKNTLIFGPTCERIAAGPKSGGGYWVLAQQKSSNKFNAYAVTTAGISSKAVTTAIGPTPNSYGIGYMKLSPQGDKLGVGYHRSTVFLLDFDNSTGVLSNLREDSANGGAYGIEFSPNGKLFYASPADSTVRQYNAYSATSTAFVASVTVLKTKGKSSYAIQLGPDGKIYITNYMKNQLGVIHNPNVVGVACSLSAAGPIIPTGAKSRIGFPNFPSNFFDDTKLEISNKCENSVTKFSLIDTFGIDSVLVNFGDTSSGLLNTTKILPDTHTYAKAGKYLITTFLYSIDSGKLVVDTILDSILISKPPIVSLGKDTVICKFDSISVNIISNLDYSIYWNDSLKATKRQVTKPGKYWVTASNECGVSSDSITIKQIFHDSSNLGNDTVFCVGDTIKFEVKDKTSKYKWNNGDTSYFIIVKKRTIIRVEKSNVCGVFKDSVLVDQIAPPIVNLGADKTICTSSGQYQILGGSTATKYSAYKWSTGLSGPNAYRILVYRAGKYWLTELNMCGSASDTVEVFGDNRLTVKLRSDTSFCQGDSILLKTNGTSLPNYNWSTGSSDSTIWASKSGTYRLTSINSCGSFLDQVKITVNQPIVPSVSRGSDTLISSIANSYQWYSSGVLITNETKKKYTLISAGNFKVFTTDLNGCKAESKVSVIEVIYADTVKVPNFVQYNNMQNGEIKLFPNPVRNTLTIEFSEIEDQEFTLQIFDNKGALVLDENISVSGQGNSKTIDFKNIAKGEYLIRLSNSKSVNTFRVVKVE